MTSCDSSNSTDPFSLVADPADLQVIRVLGLGRAGLLEDITVVVDGLTVEAELTPETLAIVVVG